MNRRTFLKAMGGVALSALIPVAGTIGTRAKGPVFLGSRGKDAAFTIQSDYTVVFNDSSPVLHELQWSRDGKTWYTVTAPAEKEIARHMKQMAKAIKEA